MELTKLKALEICRDVWKWIEENPDKDKDDWGGWEKLGYKKDNSNEYIMNNCPCCEFASMGSLWNCNRCLLLDLWKSYDKTGKLLNNCICEYIGPYRDWLYARTSDDRKQAAHEIWVAAEKKIKELN